MWDLFGLLFLFTQPICSFLLFPFESLPQSYLSWSLSRKGRGKPAPPPLFHSILRMRAHCCCLCCFGDFFFFFVGGGSRVDLCAWLGMGFFKSTATCPHVCMSANVIYYLLQRPKLKKDRREGGGKTEGPYSYRQALPLPCRNRTLL